MMVRTKSEIQSELDKWKEARQDYIRKYNDPRSSFTEKAIAMEGIKAADKFIHELEEELKNAKD